MTWLFHRKRAGSAPVDTPTADAEIARLTARADLIAKELETVVKQMSEMLRNAPGKVT